MLALRRGRVSPADSRHILEFWMFIAVHGKLGDQGMLGRRAALKDSGDRYGAVALTLELKFRAVGM